MNDTTPTEQIPVIVTTEHRGVFFGYIAASDMEAKAKIRIYRVRNVIYWSAATGGFLGLAVTGPAAESRIGAEAPETFLHDITSVTRCAEAAVEAFNAIDS